MQQQLQLSPVDENAQNSTDMEQSHSGADTEPAPKAARQARMDVTVVVCSGAVGGQQTCHSNLSGGSGTSDEATVTINNNPRLATPALTGMPFSNLSSCLPIIGCLYIQKYARSQMISTASWQSPAALRDFSLPAFGNCDRHATCALMGSLASILLDSCRAWKCIMTSG